MKYRSIVLATLVAVFVAGSVFAAPYSSVGLYASNQYFGTLYAREGRPDILFAYFKGEAISLKIQFHNGSDTAMSLVLPSNEPSRVLRVRQLRGGSRVDVAFDPTVVRKGGLTTPELMAPVTLQRQMDLGPGEAIVFQAVLQTQGLDPGDYAFMVESDARDGAGLAVAPNALIDFELRPTTSQDRSEIARRRAYRAVEDNDEDEVRRALALLRAEHPNSYVAYVLEGDLASSQGRPSAAAAAYRRALQILQAGQDTLLIRWNKPEDVAKALRSVRSDIDLIERPERP